MLAAILGAVGWLVAGAGASPKVESGEQRYVVILDEGADRPGEVAKRHAEQEGAKLERVFTKSTDGYAARLSATEAKAISRKPGVAAVGLDPRGEPAAQTTSLMLRRIYAADSDCNPADNAAVNQNLKINCLDDVRVDADVAILDTPIPPGNPELSMVSAVDCFAKDPTPSNSDPSDHTGCVPANTTPGTECLETHGENNALRIGALDNGVGDVGVAPGARIWSVGVADKAPGWPSPCNPPAPFYMSDVIAGVEWVTSHAADIEVANMSMQFDVPTDPAGQALAAALEDAIDASIDAGVVYVVAAGNKGEPLTGTIPAKYPRVITTTAIFDSDGAPGGAGPNGATCPVQNPPPSDQDDTNAETSNYGPAAGTTDPWAPGADIAAPGTCTSTATNHVSGAAAILASADNPNNATDVAAIRNTLLTTGNTASKANGGWDDETGTTREPLLDVSDETDFDPMMGLGLEGYDEIVTLDAISVTPGTIDLYARGQNNQLRHKRFRDERSGWTGWTNYGGTLSSAPGVVNRSGSELVDLFAVNNSGGLVQRWYHPSTGWSAWSPATKPAGTDLTPDQPDPVARYVGHIDLFVHGTDGTLYQKWWSSGSGWSSWGGFSSTPLASGTASVSRYSGYLDTVGRDDAGTVRHRWYHPTNGWSQWGGLGAPPGLQVLGQPAAAAPSSGQIDVLVRASDNAIWLKRWVSGSGWADWSSLGGNWASSPAVASPHPGVVSLFAVDNQSNVKWNTWTPSGWTGWALTR